jgi:hypothetical protein
VATSLDNFESFLSPIERFALTNVEEYHRLWHLSLPASAALAAAPSEGEDDNIDLIAIEEEKAQEEEDLLQSGDICCAAMPGGILGNSTVKIQRTFQKRYLSERRKLKMQVI